MSFPTFFLLFYSTDLASRVSLLMYLFQPLFFPVFFSLCLPRCLFSLVGVFNSWAMLAPLLLKLYLHVSFMQPWSHPLRQMRVWNNLTTACSIIWAKNGIHKPLTPLDASLHSAVSQCIIVYLTSLLALYPPKNFLNIWHKGWTE